MPRYSAALLWRMWKRLWIKATSMLIGAEEFSLPDNSSDSERQAAVKICFVGEADLQSRAADRDLAVSLVRLLKGPEVRLWLSRQYIVILVTRVLNRTAPPGPKDSYRTIRLESIEVISALPDGHGERAKEKRGSAERSCAGMTDLEHFIIAAPAPGHQFLPAQKVVLVLLFALDALVLQPDIHRVEISLNFHMYNFSVGVDQLEYFSDPASVIVLPQLPQGMYVLHVFFTNKKQEIVSSIQSSMFEVVDETRQNQAGNVAAADAGAFVSKFYRRATSMDSDNMDALIDGREDEGSWFGCAGEETRSDGIVVDFYFITLIDKVTVWLRSRREGGSKFEMELYFCGCWNGSTIAAEWQENLRQQVCNCGCLPTGQCLDDAKQLDDEEKPNSRRPWRFIRILNVSSNGGWMKLSSSICLCETFSSGQIDLVDNRVHGRGSIAILFKEVKQNSQAVVHTKASLDSACSGDSFQFSLSEVQAWEAQIANHLPSQTGTLPQPLEQQEEEGQKAIHGDGQELLEVGWMKPVRMSTTQPDEMQGKMDISSGQQAVDGVTSVVYDEDYSLQHATTNVRNVKSGWKSLQKKLSDFDLKYE
eukprot:763263-Hanusia_phi.AAC.1